MPKPRLVAIFGRNLLDEPKQAAGFDALMEYRDHKPFECVGEGRESRAAMASLAIAEIARGNTPLLAAQRYPVIYADPPWRYEHSQTVSREIENQYPTMTLEEICALYPTVSQFVAHEYPNPKRLEYLKKQFFERNGEIDIEKMKISSIMIWCWVTQEGLSTQVCCDLLSSKDGTLMGPRRSKDDPQVVDMYVTSNDLFYAD